MDFFAFENENDEYCDYIHRDNLYDEYYHVDEINKVKEQVTELLNCLYRTGDVDSIENALKEACRLLDMKCADIVSKGVKIRSK